MFDKKTFVLGEPPNNKDDYGSQENWIPNEKRVAGHTFPKDCFHKSHPLWNILIQNVNIQDWNELRKHLHDDDYDVLQFAGIARILKVADELNIRWFSNIAVDCAGSESTDAVGLYVVLERDMERLRDEINRRNFK